MDFHSIILDDRLLKRVHELCNKHGRKEKSEKEQIKEMVDTLVDSVVDNELENASMDAHIDPEEERTEEEYAEDSLSQSMILPNSETDLSEANLSVLEKAGIDTSQLEKFIKSEESKKEEFIPSENYYFYYRLETTGNSVQSKPEYLEFSFDNGIGFELPLPPKIDKKNFFDEKTLYITIYDYETVTVLRKLMGDAELHSNTPCVDIQNLYWAIQDLRIKYQQPEYHTETLKRILDFTEDMFSDRYETMDRMISANKITFDSLWYLFDKVDTLYTFEKYDEQICARHKSFCYGQDSTGERNRLELYSTVITVFSGKKRKEECTYQIKSFTGQKDIDSFKIKEATVEQKKQFKEQSEKILKLADGFHHMKIHGRTYTKHHDDMIKRELKERVMVDQEGCKKFGPRVTVFLNLGEIDELKEEDHYIVFPFVQTYNLGIDKTWGLAHVNYLTPVEYQEDAFNHLVLSQDKKDIIQALVSNKTIEYKDFICDKGNNTVILLSGTPGVGKSLTAEATSEYLKLPLYRINVGDLGTNPEHMESILHSIFKLTERWNAIILIDEVDIFVEERSDLNVVQNAMVCTFMKILDFNSCIIFLTTNRLQRIDSAVRSRINLLLHYKDLDRKHRTNIWKGLLERWDINLTKETISELASKEINGREIRNYIKSIISIHKQRKAEIDDESMLSTFNMLFEMTTEFDKKRPPSLYQ